MKASLVMFKADGSRRDFPLRTGPIVVGRKNSCELRIPLSSVSRQHCEITLADDTVKLRDLGSSNGTYHNSIRVQEAELEAGDEVVVGPVVFTVVIDGVPDDIKPVRTIVNSADSHGSAMTVAGDQPDALSADDITSQLDDEPASAPTLDLSTADAADDDAVTMSDLDAELERNQDLATRSGDSSGLDFDFDDLTKDD
jgi:pSer/pThr/pTyr-binding forkhead associated (FHA) protein